MPVTSAVQPLLFASTPVTLAECRVARTRNYRLVCQLVALWHSTLPVAPPGFRAAFLVLAGNAPVAVATWGRPVARLEDQVTTLELTRQAHGPNAPRNLGTWFLARQREWIRENMPEVVRLISYMDADVHAGTIYMFDHWHKVYQQETTHSWHNRPGRAGTEVKQRIKWERQP